MISSPTNTSITPSPAFESLSQSQAIENIPNTLSQDSLALLQVSLQLSIDVTTAAMQALNPHQENTTESMDWKPVDMNSMDWEPTN